jgi:ribonucleoside-diphosphate reductase alpha subunit
MINEREMRVLKRDGKYEEVAFDKILNRVKKVGSEVNLSINYSLLVMKIIDQLYDGIPTTKIDELTAEQCACNLKHPDYEILGSRLTISNHHKNTNPIFSENMQQLYDYKDIHGIHYPIVSKKLIDCVNKNKDFLDNLIQNDRDYLIDYFGFKTLEKSYLMKINGKIIERPQHMWLRVAIGIHDENIEKIKETYDLMSQKYFTHATPTLFNAGTPRPQLSSCYLLALEEDSINGIYSTLKDCAQISKWAGGIGLHIHNVRGTGSHIRGTNGTSNGIVPMLRVFNNTARYVDQGGGRRNGSFAIYLEPWHSDIEVFLEMRKNHGDEEMKARDLFYALWIPDLFMEKIKNDEEWCLFCPDECPGLHETYGEKFIELYKKYEQEEKYKKKIKARDLWFKVLDSQMETGTPYLLYKDAANKKSNQKNLGTIKSSNLCTEIIEYSDDTETAVCNLASISLSNFVDRETKKFNYEKLHSVTKVVTENLNNIIDINYYPTDKTKKSNLRHRPIGIGVQGLADTFAVMDIPFHSDAAIEINKNIFETMYHAAVEKSNELAIDRYNLISKFSKTDRYNDDGLLTILNKYEIKNEDKDSVGAYSTFEGSPASEGNLQFDLWNVKPSDRYDWDKLKNSIKKYGIRNSLSIAPMPTASTSRILGNNECFEPFTSNIYMRRTLAGEFIVANKYLMDDLSKLGLWNDKIKNNIIANKGSVQYIDGLPENIKSKYKIVWEIPMKHLINMSRDRGAFICQSQSLNLWVEDPNYNILTSMHFYSWNQGLKTGIYYLRRKPKHQPQQFTIEPEKKTSDSDETDEICEMCSA